MTLSTPLRASAPVDGDVDFAAWAAATLAEAGGAVDGLYVATASAGGRESVAFLRAGMETGLAFANPRLFPWSLANSPTGAIARALGVRGPTYTLLGGASAVAAALDHALDDVVGGRVTAALVVGLDADHATMRLAAVTVRAGVDPDGRRRLEELVVQVGRAVPARADAASALGVLLEHLPAEAVT